MSEELVNSVQGMLQEEQWTRTAISNFTISNLKQLEEILEKAIDQNCTTAIAELCSKQLENNSKESIIALYLTGMIGLMDHSLDNSALVALVDIFDKNLKDTLVEELLNSILERSPNNRFALRRLAEYYKKDDNKDNRVWDLYAKIVKDDFEEADMAKALADRYSEQKNKDESVKYYKIALNRYINAKNANAVKEVWTTLTRIIPEDVDFFLREQKKIAKTISEDTAANVLSQLYETIKDTEDKDTAIEILKIILQYDEKSPSTRNSLVECYRQKYAGHSHLEEYIEASNISKNLRSVFEAINDFEKHIAFDAGSFVCHSSWGVGRIKKVEGEILTVNFGKKNGVKQISLKMAVNALKPLANDHIWVIKATSKNPAELKEKVKKNVADFLKIIIKSFDNNCDDKKIKAELVPSILTASEWTSWHSKAQEIFRTDPTFDVNPMDNSCHIVRSREISLEERLANEFRAEKSFFSRIDIMMRYTNNAETDKNSELYRDMFNYFAGFMKSINVVDAQVVGAYLSIQKLLQNHSSWENPAKFTFSDLYSEIENPRELYLELKDTKNTSLKEDFINSIEMFLADWDDQFIKIFPTVLKKSMLDTLIKKDKTQKVQRLVKESFEDYKNYRNAALFFYKECRNEEWYKNAGISFEKQLVTMVNIISTCYREINYHLNTTENKKTIKAACTLLFQDKNGDEPVNTMLNYMLENGPDTIARMYTMINDVKDLESSYKAQLRSGILNKYPDYKFEETEIKQEAPTGLLVTQKMYDAKKAEEEDIETVQIPQNSEEVNEARSKGDLSENAEYETAKAKQRELNAKLAQLKADLAKANIFDTTTVTTSIISFGTAVTVHNNKENTDATYTILGPWESDPENGIISYMSPLGNKLLNKKAGENIVFKGNDGREWDLTVKEINVAKF